MSVPIASMNFVLCKKGNVTHKREVHSAESLCSEIEPISVEPRGLRFAQLREAVPQLPGKPSIVLTGDRIALAKFTSASRNSSFLTSNPLGPWVAYVRRTNARHWSKKQKPVQAFAHTGFFVGIRIPAENYAPGVIGAPSALRLTCMLLIDSPETRTSVLAILFANWVASTPRLPVSDVPLGRYICS